MSDAEQTILRHLVAASREIKAAWDESLGEGQPERTRSIALAGGAVRVAIGVVVDRMDASAVTP